MNIDQHETAVIEKTKYWLESFIINHNLCQFAKREFELGSIHFAVSSAKAPEVLLTDLMFELDRLDSNDEIATTLLIHPNTLTDFNEYNQFLNIVDDLLDEQNLVGVYQIASFHPSYQFFGTQLNDAENYTNRSPFPLLHILREEMVEAAVEAYLDINSIPERNITLMNQLGGNELKSYFSNIQKLSAG